MADQSKIENPKSKIDGDDLVTLAKARSEFEAGNIVAILREAGIEAFAFGNVQATLAFEARFTRVPVQVRADDLERAKEVLRQNAIEAGALDWENVELGEREDALPLHRPNRLPPAARLGLVIAILAALIFTIGAVALLWSLLG